MAANKWISIREPSLSVSFPRQSGGDAILDSIVSFWYFTEFVWIFSSLQYCLLKELHQLAHGILVLKTDFFLPRQKINLNLIQEKYLIHFSSNFSSISNMHLLWNETCCFEASIFYSQGNPMAAFWHKLMFFAIGCNFEFKIRADSKEWKNNTRVAKYVLVLIDIDFS